MPKTHQREPTEVVLTDVVDTSHGTIGKWHLLMETWGGFSCVLELKQRAVTLAVVVPVENTRQPRNANPVHLETTSVAHEEYTRSEPTAMKPTRK